MYLLIFGAQGYALGAYNAIKTLYPQRPITSFVVTAIGDNAPFLGGLPVREISNLSEEMSVDDKNNTAVLIATPENVQPEIEETLEFYGFHNYARLTSERWDELMKLYHTKLGKFLPLSALPAGCSKPFLRMYMAKSHVDRPLRYPVILPEYVFPIQVGREKAGTAIADLADNTGYNISGRNGNYSELTGLYWIWKNKLNKCNDDSNQYCGFGQYRRMLKLSDDDLMRLVDNNVDVALPYPMPYEPTIHAHHERYINGSDWDALLKVLVELDPEYAKVFPDVLNQQFLYNYNVILAKKTVLRDYCSWLFPILLKTEEMTDGMKRSDRYLGYMAETLETLYFMKNSETSGGKLNVVHTLCKLYV